MKPTSKQRSWRARNLAAGLCSVCGWGRLATKYHCRRCADKHAARSRAWAAAHPDYNREWYARHPGANAAYCRAYSARQKGR